MTPTRTHLVLVAIALLVVAPAVPPGGDTARAAQHSFVIEQGDRCVEVSPLQGDRNAVDFYDYRRPGSGDSYTYSSFMPEHLTADDVSRLFLYEGPDGVSLVIVHNERGASGDGTAATFRFDGLPSGGEWVVMDDDYDDRDDRFSRNRIDWSWYGDRTDGAVFRGLDRSGTAVTIRGAFDEDAALYDEPVDRSGTTRAWQFLTGNREDPNAVGLRMNRPLTVRTGSCTDEAPPDAALAVGDGVAGQPVTLDAGNSTDNRGVAEYRWDLDGDGAVDRRSADPRIGVTYDDPGEYRVRVTVADAADNTDTAAANLTVEADDPPTPRPEVARPDEPSEGEQVVFDASNSTDDTGIAEYRWRFGDGAAATGETVTHRYDANGTYEVTLETVDEGGNNATATLDVRVRAPDETPPEAAASVAPQTVPAGANVTFDAGDSTDDRGIASFRWAFGDGGTAEGATATHAYADPGNYTATLTVTDRAGNENRTTARVRVRAPDETPPNASLSVDPNETDVGDEVTFDASGSTDDRRVTEYRWDFDGDDGVDRRTDGATTTYAYDEAGTYNATVTVVDPGNNTDAARARVVAEERQAISGNGGGSGGGGGSSGGSGGGSSGGATAGGGDPPVLTDTESLGPNAAAVDVRNGRADDPVEADLPETDAAAETGVRFSEVVVDLAADDPHFVVETARGTDGADGVPADRTLGTLAVGAKYLDAAAVENVTYVAAVDRSRLDAAGPDDVAVYQRRDGAWERVNATVEAREGELAVRAQTGAVGDIAVGVDRAVAVTDAALSDEPVAVGDPVTVTATVRNEGDGDRVTVNLTADGTVVATETVAAPAGETAEVRFEAALDPGEHDLAVGGEAVGTVAVTEAPDIRVADVSVNATSVPAGGAVAVTATVENEGAAPGEREVALTLSGERVGTETVEVPPGETREVTFVREVEDAGSYTARVGEASAEFEVTGTDGGSNAPEAPVPGFGPVAALVALVAAALLARRQSA